MYYDPACNSAVGYIRTCFVGPDGASGWLVLTHAESSNMKGMCVYGTVYHLSLAHASV